MYEQLALYIDGEFVAGEGRRTQDVINPARWKCSASCPTPPKRIWIAR